MAAELEVALITGGASGIGLAITKHLLAEGWKVAIVDFNDAAGTSVAEDLGPNVIFQHCNVAVYNDQAQAFAKTWSQWGRIDFVFANAGFGDRSDLFGDAKELQNGVPAQPDIVAFDVCALGPIWSAYLAVHFFKKNQDKKGKLMITSSGSGIHANASVPLYCSAKAAVISLTRSVAKRMRNDKLGITANCICPAVVSTPLLDASFIDSIPAWALTPMSTIVKSIDMVLTNDALSGRVLECAGNEIVPRAEYSPCNKVSAFLNSEDFMAHLVETGQLDKIHERGDDENAMVIR